MAATNGRVVPTETAHHAEMRNRLLTAVERLLGTGSSFAELSVEQIVTEAGLSRATFYVYFEDKGDLLRAWFAQILDEIEAAAKKWWHLDSTATKDDLRRALAEVVWAYHPHIPVMAAVFDAATYDLAVRAEVDKMMGRNIAGLRAHIADGQSAGWIARDLPPDQSAAWLMWMAERGQHQMILGADSDEVDRLVDAYADVVWRALYEPARCA